MNDLINSIRNGQVIIFVGAGVSMGLGLPSFQKLINHLADELDYEPEVFNQFGSFLELAEYYKIQKGGSIGPLRSWLDREWHANVDISKSKVHDLITMLKCKIIYTTNYDRWLEEAHNHYKIPNQKIVSVGDVANVKGDAVQIVKFHGDFDDDDSIVLTESSYFDRLGFDSPLDIKLRSDAMGKTVLFIGYSLTDINLRYLLYKIHIQWESSRYAKARPKSYIFLGRPNPIQETILKERGITSFVSHCDDQGKGLEDFLTELAKGAWGAIK